MGNMSHVLCLSCPDRVGIVARVAGFLEKQGWNILQSDQFGDTESGNFFLRMSVESVFSDSLPAVQFPNCFTPIATEFDMQWGFYDLNKKPNVIILVSKFGHCLNDLLFRVETGNLGMTVKGIISNHDTFASLAQWHQIPFYSKNVVPETKTAVETWISNFIEEEDIELIILARYMQILSQQFCHRHRGKIINIHHSFLPSFKGAHPYRQAHRRGVKLIGATAHYVTEDLDEGPIIEQSVERVDHRYTPDMLTAVSRDIESLVLARAVEGHIQHRVFLNGTKTVVFR
ncbi:formyltetrahydrofolate deformylase [Gloeocapsa sp. PCC 73106]|uniref:formyltetrahydrofolate deformylase n=1 Tax=Gloeocapsa sp. PCC 73106 TaxID=102232 RepID=UPI0002ABAE7A|nr:formyltetrahydrofolate deformylase [Gloeocapsa sp. PCC 73106]ELR98183.1 formyltetrahydrofolate deformylase [Gloeocapsa sp. PCC 73106]